MGSHSPIPESTTSDPLKWSSYDVPWKDGAASSLAWQPEQYTSLDTETCLAAVTRFIARRGYPNTIISDNGTNFVGAANELKEFMNEWDKAKVESDLAEKKIFWTSILPELHTLVESRKDWFKVARKSWLQSWTTEASQTRYSAQQCVL